MMRMCVIIKNEYGQDITRTREVTLDRNGLPPGSILHGDKVYTHQGTIAETGQPVYHPKAEKKKEPSE